MPHRRRTEFESQPLEDIRFSLQPFDVTVKAVCAGCNNGWMSRLEDRAKPLLMPGLQGHGKQLSRGAQDTLATWAFKTALVFGLTLRSPRPVPDEHYRYLLEHGRPPEQCVVWMGAYNGPEPGFLHEAGMAISRPGARVDSDSRPNVYVFTLTMGPFLFQVLASGDAEAFDVTNATYGDRRARRIWPTGSTFVWSPSGGLVASELQPFADAIYDRLASSFQAPGATP